jgi:hypothetical protein
LHLWYATKRNGLLLQIKKNNVFDSWSVLWFTCIERDLNRFPDIQDACTELVSFGSGHPPTPPNESVKNRIRCIINQTPPNNIRFRTIYSPYACHDKGSIYESLSFQNHRRLISSSVHIPEPNETNFIWKKLSHFETIPKW